MSKPVVITITADTKGLKSGLGDAEKAAQKFDGTVGDLSKSLAGSAAKFGAGLALAGWIKAGTDEAIELNKVMAQSAAVVKSTGGAAGVTAKQMRDAAASIEDYSGVNEVAIQKGQNLLATFTNVKNAAGEGGAVFDRTTQLMVDMSVAMGTDATSAAMQLGKALNDPATGLSKLAEAGVGFSEEQKRMVAELVASGETAKAQGVILDEVAKQFGGSAQALGDSAAGQIAKFHDALADSGRDVGEQLLPVALDVLPSLAAAATAVAPVVGNAAGSLGLMVKAATPLLELLGTMPPAVMQLVTTFAALKAAQGKIGSFAGMSSLASDLQKAAATFKGGGGIGASLGQLATGANIATLSVAALGVVWANWQAQQQEARGRIDSWKAAMQQGGTAAEEAGEKFAGSLEEMRIFGSQFGRLGVGAKEFFETLKSGDVDGFRQKLTDAVKSGDLDFAYLEPMLAKVGRLSGEYKKALKEFESAGGIEAVGLKNIGATAEMAAGPLARSAQLLQQLGAELGEFKGGSEFASSWAQAMQGLEAGLQASNGAIGLNTEAARSNQAAVKSAADSALAFAAEQIKAGASAGQVAAGLSTISESLVSTLTSSGMARGSAAELANQYLTVQANSLLAATAIDAYRAALDRNLGGLLSASQAHIQFQSSAAQLATTYQATGAAINAAGNDFNYATEQGRQLAGSFNSVVAAIAAEVDAQVRAGAIEDSATARKDAQIGKLRELANQYPQLSGVVQTYIAEVERTPAEKVTKVDLKGVDVAISSAIGLHDAISNIPDSKTVTVRQVFEGVQQALSFGKLAQGAIVRRPQFALIGEDGDEVVLPLTKPARARELAAKSGLAQVLGYREFAQGGIVGSSANSSAAGGVLELRLALGDRRTTTPDASRAERALRGFTFTLEDAQESIETAGESLSGVARSVLAAAQVPESGAAGGALPGSHTPGGGLSLVSDSVARGWFRNGVAASEIAADLGLTGSWTALEIARHLGLNTGQQLRPGGGPAVGQADITPTELAELIAGADLARQARSERDATLAAQRAAISTARLSLSQASASVPSISPTVNMSVAVHGGVSREDYWGIYDTTQTAARDAATELARSLDAY